MRIPGPSSFLTAATNVGGGALDMVLDIPATVGDMLDLLGRAGDVMDRVEAMVGRGEEMLDRAESTFAQVEAMVTDGEAMLDRAAGVLSDAENATMGATATLAVAAEMTRDAGVTADSAASLLQRTEAMLEPLEELSAKALPSAQAFVDKLDPDEVEALIGMTDRLPVLLAHLENNVLPMLGQLDRVGPDVHEILDSVQDITHALHGLPGGNFLRRRGERKDPEVGDHG